MLSPLEDIKSKIDIVQHIGQYVKLAPSGRSMRGLCPFHQEKTPSFFVSPERQVWYCFGCQKGGDLFKFVMEREKVDFPEALKILADRAGVQLRREDPRIQSMRNRTFDALKAIQEYYRGEFARNPNAKKYCAARGLSEKTMETFGLGFAPAGWQNTSSFLKAKGFTPQDMEQAGLIIRRMTNDERLMTQSQSGANGTRRVESGYYDRFRSRVTFPIFDHMDRIVGFSGRILPPEFGGPQDGTQEAKYINTPDTLVYQKGRVLYGFNTTKDAVRESDSAVLVEGNMDMIMGWQGGITNIVAVSGTGLTEEQLAMLKRSCSSLILDFDMDRAGEMATDRAIGLALKTGFSVKILTLPDGKDMADFVRNHPTEIPELLARATDSMQYYFDNAFGKLGAGASVEDKKRAVTYLLPRIKMVARPLDQHVWVEQLAHRIGVPDRVIEDELKRTPTLLDIANDAEEDTTGKRVEHLFMKTRLDALAERALGLALKAPQLLSRVADAVQSFPYRFRDFAAMLAKIPPADVEAGTYPEGIDQESVNYLVLRAEYEMALLDSKTDPAMELELTLGELERESIRVRLREMTMALKEAEQGKNEERIAECARQVAALSHSLGKLQQEDGE